jgi:uncharacterized protein YjiS (DUF1127 family)
VSDPELLVQVLARAFDAAGVAYWIGGSLASIVHGFPRLTQDVDFVADLREEQVAAFLAQIAADFYVDPDTAREAVRTRTSFNVIHLETMMKADIFVMPDTDWARSERARRQLAALGDSPETFYVASAEDMILQKLEWYRLTGERSDRQWGDVQGMLKVQGRSLDFAYLRRWAGNLALDDLLNQALADAGLTEA